MIYIQKIASFVPERRCRLPDLVARDAEIPTPSPQEIALFRTVFRLNEVSVSESGDLFDLLDRSLCQIVPTEQSERQRIKYILHCHASPCVYPPGVGLLNALKNKHRLQHALAIGLTSDQCATPLSALSLAETILAREDVDAQVLVLTGEVGFHPTLRVIPNTTVMGDASAAFLLGRRAGANGVLSVAQRRFKQAQEGQLPTGVIPTPVVPYGDDLIGVVKDALDAARAAISDVKLVLGHNVNAISWKFFAKNYPCDIEKLYLENISKIGHCFTSDPFINYCDARAAKRLNEGDLFMFVSVGTSSSYVASVVRH